MKKVVISGSSKLQEQVKYWYKYFTDKGYKILDYPKSVAQENYMNDLPKVYQNFYTAIENTDMYFLMNEEKNGIPGYIGTSSIAELHYAIMQNYIHNKNIDIYILNMPSKELSCYDEVQFFLDSGWIKLLPKDEENISHIDLINDLRGYTPFNYQEERDKEYFFKIINKYSRYANPLDLLLLRENKPVHFSATAFVVNKDRTKFLSSYSNIYDGWTYPGGHADGNENLLYLAILEVYEEIGIKATILDESIFSIQVLQIPNHVRKDNFVSAHTHLDVIYLLEADDTVPIIITPDKNIVIKWFTLDENAYASLAEITKPVHKKLVEKLTKNIDIYSWLKFVMLYTNNI